MSAPDLSKLSIDRDTKSFTPRKRRKWLNKWTIGEEFYIFGTEVWNASKPNENVSAVGRLPILLPFTRDKVHVLLSLDTEKMDISDLPFLTKGGDYPQAWTRDYGRGRVFYTTLGHRDDIWGSDANFKAHVVGGIRWALRLEN